MLLLSTLPGLVISKSNYNKGYDVWTDGLVMTTEEWKSRKSVACEAGTDHFLSTNYDTVANRVNLDSNPIRRCVPLGDRKLQLTTYHVNELGFPADLPFASAIPNPLAQQAPEGKVLVAQVYRLSCDFDNKFYAPVYYLTVNRTELISAETDGNEW